MKQLFGILLIIGGIFLGLYVGIWVMFVGGLFDIIEAVKADVTDKSDILWGVVKMFSAGFVGALSAYVLIIPGIAFGSSNSTRSSKKRFN